MRRVLLLMVTMVVISPIVWAQDAKQQKASGKSVKTNGIEWLSLDEAQVRMKKQPRKVFIDVYTDWCGWCKVMDKKTFSNPEVIKYINKNFYAVKMNPEKKDSVRFVGKMYHPMMLAAELMQGKMSYPTTVIMEENFQNPQPIPGYLDVPTIERILKFLNEGVYKVKTFDDYSKDFKPSWPVAAEAQG